MKEATMQSCKNRLAALWLIGSGVVFFIFVAQSILHKYDNQLSEAWGWLVPSIFPTLTLMVGVLVTDATGSSRGKRKKVDPFLFNLARGLSVFYLFVLLMTLLLEPIANKGIEPVKFLKTSNIWLTPILGLTTYCLGAFFIKVDAAEQK